MKANAHVKARGPTRSNTQQVIFELKHKVVLALNKLADRDTCQIGVDELEKIAECLTPDSIAAFLSCILDTDKEQKSAVRKECIRLIGVLVSFHGHLIGQHLVKMVASIVKRLKDPDTVVRDACVETMGILASKLSNHGDGSDVVFVALVKPLFEALGEQNKQMQSGSALCLASVIDNAHDPPVSILQRMLTRTIKFLKNPHFMAKPAVIELNRSIIQAGGAPSKNALSAAITSIQEALKNSDWATRKAASAALGEIASSGGSYLSFFRASCISSLESCRFDKVKPVRETVIHALQYWKSLPGSYTPEPSDTGSSIKGDFSDLNSTNESMQKNVTLNKSDSKRRIPLSAKSTCHNYVDSQHSKADDWHIEIAVPRIRNISSPNSHNEESEGSSVTKMLEGLNSEMTSATDIVCDYIPMDDKQDYSSVSNGVAENFVNKSMRASHDSLEEGGVPKAMRRNHQFAPEGIDSEERICSSKMQDRRSLDSTVTETSSQSFCGKCSHVASEVACIRKQLLEIENKQSNLMELLQVFSTGLMDGMSMLQSKVLSMEHEIDKLGHALLHKGRNYDSAILKSMKQSHSGSSPRLSTCTPRSSVDLCNVQPSLLSAKNSDIWEDKTFGGSRLVNSAKQSTGIWTHHSTKSCRSTIGKPMQNFSGQGAHNMGSTRKIDAVFPSVSTVNARQNGSDSKNILWQRVKDFLCEGDLDSAYIQALCSNDELVLVELLDITGPALESLSHKTASDVLGTLASYFLEQRFMKSIIPWLHQVVDLCTIHGPEYLIPSAKARREFLSAIQEAANMEFSNPAERRSVTQLAMKLRQLWGKSSQ